MEVILVITFAVGLALPYWYLCNLRVQVTQKFDHEKQSWQKERDALIKENLEGKARVRELMNEIADLKVEYRNKFESLLKFSKN